MFMVTVVGSILLVQYWDNLEMIPIFITMAKFGISATFNMAFIVSVQLIPTIVAATVFGYCNVSARSLTILSPIIAEMDYPTPLYICMGVAAFASVTSLFIV